MRINVQEIIWQAPPFQVTLNTNEIHVWRVSLNMLPGTIERLSQLLAPDERAKAERFRFARDRNQFISGRGLLRVLLGRYLGCEPQDVRFCYSSYGKPSLDDPLAISGLQFNLSHSHQLALLAFTYTRNIGVDIEYMRPDVEFEQLAEHFFAPDECAVLQSLPLSERQEAFYNCWTRKEAYIKARGEGLSIPLESFTVSLRPDEPAALLRSREHPSDVPRWSLRALTPGEHYAAALAVDDTHWQLRCWHWLEEAERSFS
jgi:4'-phosphopantetheinyl transferase